jgi:hypothetical protein
MVKQALVFINEHLCHAGAQAAGRSCDEGGFTFDLPHLLTTWHRQI